MSYVLRSALALAGVVALAACAPRQPIPGAPGRGAAAAPPDGGFTGLVVRPVALLLTEFDADRDRRLTLDELRSGAEDAWRSADANADGVASPFEFTDWARLVMGSETPTPGRVAFDRNLDDAISHAEFVATLTDEFVRLDANSDNVVERAELVRLIEPRAGAFAGSDGAPRPGGQRRRPPDGRGPGANAGVEGAAAITETPTD